VLNAFPARLVAFPVAPLLIAATLALTFGPLGAGAGEPASTTGAPLAANLPGRVIFARGGDIWQMANGKVEAVTRDGGWRQPQFAPDGSQIAAIGMYTSASELFVLDPDGTGARALTRNRQIPIQQSDWAFYPRWSPDGQAIAYITDRASFYPMLWRMNPDGSGARQLTFPSNGADAVDAFSWSPDGRTIAASRYNVGQPQIVLIDVARPASSRVITRTEGGAMDPSWSPDGQYLAYVAREGSKNAIYVLEVENPERVTVVADGDLVRSPVWSPSGNALAYIGLQGGAFEIFSVDVSFNDGVAPTGKPSAVTVQFGVDPISGLSWIP
jgi:Tol biopolymer transport system component